jgi:PPK2 family polyphosphate:nucleotide phosphotransferase
METAIMDRYRVRVGQKVKLAEWAANDKEAFSGTKEEAKTELAELAQKLAELQDILYAQHKHKILVVLQAMDTGGKDGVIRSVFGKIDPQGVRVANFKVPTSIELDHDYLWRVHQQVPGKGELVIFNRSHYEDLLVVRVHELAPEKVWKKRFQQINAFERMLVDEGTTVVKFYLHIDKEEQRLRLLERIDVPEKQWKFSSGDLKERGFWKDYMQAYEDVLSKTSTREAPWYIIPANRNWYRNWLIASILVKVLKDLKMEFPPAEENVEQYRPQLAEPED